MSLIYTNLITREMPISRRRPFRDQLMVALLLHSMTAQVKRYFSYFHQIDIQSIVLAVSAWAFPTPLTGNTALKQDYTEETSLRLSPALL
jgi:hypothetical protein